MQEGQFVDTVPANTDNSCGREWDGETRRSVHIVLGYHLHILTVFIHDRCVTQHFISTGLPENGGKEPDERFCRVHSPHVSSNAQMRDETSAEMNRPDEEPVSEHDEKTDGNRNTKIEDISLHNFTSQSQPETDTLTGSDITSGPVSEHSIIRRRNKL